jgi:hypothetical protein
VLCTIGLHACKSALDALAHAPGPVICRVRCAGEVVEGADKLVCRSRTILWRADASSVLRLFGADCAERALQRERAAGQEPDPRSWRAVDVARQHARGEVTDAELEAAAAEAKTVATRARVGRVAATWAASAASAAPAEAARWTWAAEAARWTWAAAGRGWQYDELDRRLLALGPSG